MKFQRELGRYVLPTGEAEEGAGPPVTIRSTRTISAEEKGKQKVDKMESAPRTNGKLGLASHSVQWRGVASDL